VNQVFHMFTTFFLRSWAMSAARSPFAWVSPRLLAIAGRPTPEMLTLNREPALEAGGGGEALGVTDGSKVSGADGVGWEGSSVLAVAAAFSSPGERGGVVQAVVSTPETAGSTRTEFGWSV